MRAIDERWEEVNVRATDTLEKIEENGLDRRVSGRKERWPGASTSSTRQDAGNYYCNMCAFLSELRSIFLVG